jgi:hypothetical protein
MSDVAGPADPEQVVSGLEDEIVDVEQAAGNGEEGASEDTVGTVPGAPEPPD